MKITNTEMSWQASLSTPGWEFVRLSGKRPGPTTVMCRCHSAIVYAPWISDALVEYYIMSGKLTVNGEEMGRGDYCNVPPRNDGFLSAPASMEALCIMHGVVVRAKEVFDSLRKRSVSSQEVRTLLSLPWIDHLRRHVGERDLSWICDLIDEQSDEAMIELCISTARNLKSDRLLGAAKKTLQSQPGLSLRVTATLYLASKGEADSSLWQAQLHEMAKQPDELLRVVKAFYSADSNEELVDAVKQRINSGRYAYNMPFYEIIARMAAR